MAELGDVPKGAPLTLVLELVRERLAVVSDENALPDRAVTACVVWDPLEPLRPVAGGVLLLVGCSPLNPHIGRVLEGAAALAYAGVVIKQRGEDLSQVVDAATRAGLVVLSVDDDVPWSSIEALVEGAIASAAVFVEGGIEPTGDLFALANAIALMAGSAITIEDVQRRVLAHSNIEGQAIDSVRQDSILGRRVPLNQEYDAEYVALARTSRHLWFPAETETCFPRVALPVRVGGRFLGSLWAIADVTDDGLTRIVNALEGAAPSVGLELMMVAARDNTERHRRSELLAAQLGASGPDRSATLRGELPLALMGVGPLREDAVPDLYRLAHIVRLALAQVSPDVVCSPIHGTAMALIPRVPVTADRLRQLGHAVLEASRAQSPDLGCAFTARIEDTADIVAASRDIGTALTAIHGSKHRVIDIDRDRHLLVLQEVRRRTEVAGPQRFVAPVEILVAHDATHQTDYAATLLMHLDHSGDVRACARALGIHENSHRYRMGRITQLIGDDLSDPELRLVVWLQLNLLRASLT